MTAVNILPALPRRRLFPCLLAIALAAAFLTPRPAGASEDTHPPLYEAEESQERSFSTGSAFFDDAKVTGNLYYFQRKRMRRDLADGRYHNNLDHATTGVGAELNSGFIENFIGADVGAFTATDLWNSNLPFHELNFFPATNPWRIDWSDRNTRNGVSLYKALIKIKHEEIWGKAGYFQPAGPGVLGVNWSVYPGTYRGAEAGFSHKGFSMAAAWVDRYKAPWFKDAYSFRRDDDSHVAWLWSLGARYEFAQGTVFSGTTAEVAYGESEDYLKNAHFKLKNERPLGDGTLTFGYHLYFEDDSASSGPNDNFAGPATQHFLFTRYAIGEWTLRAEFTYTEAPQSSDENKGYFAYRLISMYGGAKGALEPDWNTRSDWNHNREKAVFVNVSRAFSIFGREGFEAGVTGSIGWDGKAHGYSGHLKEWAAAFDLSYTVPEGSLRGASIKAHYTEYRNSSNMPDWQGFRNAFQDERDFKLLVMIPFSS